MRKFQQNLAQKPLCDVQMICNALYQGEINTKERKYINKIYDWLDSVLHVRPIGNILAM